ncbi:DUF2637 domain-containing protein [Streptomyces sp. NPDC005878]|uniref:DUF2637 domain-containing protein n=1 Tax=Streptomyces sp. NPDC005878 TaxID=3157077 RepID=UPI0033FF4009
MQLTRLHHILIALVVAGTAVIAALGFAGSYHAVTELAAQKGFGSFARYFTIGVDCGIGVLLALDLLLTWLRIPYPLLRQTAWLLTAATIAFNAAAAWPDPIGVGMHAVIPILFVVSVEAARHAIGRIADITADKNIDGVRLSRWIVSPLGSFRIWRRMRLWEIRSYQQVLKLEQERRIYRAQLRKKYGRGWRRKAGADELLVLSLSRDGLSVAEAIALPQKEADQQEEAAAARRAAVRARTEAAAAAEAEAKHQTELRAAQAEAKRRTELAWAEAAETEARLTVEAKQRAEAEAARVLHAETEAKLARIARAEADAEAEAEAKRLQHAAEAARMEAETLAAQQAAREAQARQDRQDRAREQAQQLARATRNRSGDAPTSGSAASAPASGTASGSGRRAVSVSGSSPAPLGDKRSKRLDQITEVLARIAEAEDPKSVSLAWVQEHFGLSQTTAWDRLRTAQEMWDGQNQRGASA